MNEFLQRVESAVEKRRLLSRGQKILVAVSGGADSMALLQALRRLSAKHRWNLHVAHFNHQLRGQASDGDEKFVRAAAKKLSLPVFSERGDVAGFARRSKISVEMAARKLRHEFLARVARQNGICSIALAHHADDQVELFFLRLLRGSGGEGLAGMKWRSPSPADSKITLVRPLLGFSKAELLDFIRDYKIRFRHDATNFSPDYLRNRIRNELLPLLQKKYQPGLSKSVLRLMEIVGAEAEFVSDIARHWLANSRSSRGDEAQIELADRESAVSMGWEISRVISCKFNNLPPAVQRRVLQSRLAGLGVAPDFELVEQLRNVPGKFVSVGANLSVARTAAGTLNCRERFKEDFKPDELSVSLTGALSEVNFSGRQFYWRIQPQKKFVRPKPQPGAESFDAGLVGDEIILRHWRPGDRFQPIGLKSAAKLQDLFVNARIPAARRRELVLATTATGDIFWVEGLRIGEQFKLTGRTRRKLIWEYTSQV